MRASHRHLRSKHGRGHRPYPTLLEREDRGHGDGRIQQNAIDGGRVEASTMTSASESSLARLAAYAAGSHRSIWHGRACVESARSTVRAISRRPSLTAPQPQASQAILHIPACRHSWATSLPVLSISSGKCPIACDVLGRLERTSVRTLGALSARLLK